MAVQESDRITQKIPRLGVESYQQSADNFNEKKQPQYGDMSESDKRLFHIVQNCEEYAKAQLENLSWNSEVLADVLYANIKKLLSDKLNDEQFIKQLADSLIANGDIVDSGTNQPVSNVGAQDYDRIVSSLDSAIALIKANKPSIDRLTQEIQNNARQTSDDGSEDSEKSRMIDALLNRLTAGQKTVDRHVQTTRGIRNQIGTRLQTLVSSMMAQHRSSANSEDISATKKRKKTRRFIVVPILNGRAASDQARVVDSTNQPEDPQFPSRISPAKGGLPGMVDKAKQERNERQTSSNTRLVGMTLAGAQKKVDDISTRLGAFGSFLRKKIASAAGRTFKAAKNLLSSAMYAIRNAVAPVMKAAKQFWRASRAVGRMIQSAGSIAISAGRRADYARKRVMNMAQQLHGKTKMLAPLTLFSGSGSGAWMIAKMGWKLTKWVGKRLWRGIKNLVVGSLNFFRGLFGLGRKFDNTEAYYARRLGHGVQDKKYRFMVRPIAGILAAVFGFAMGVAKSIADFSRQAIPSLIERIEQSLHSIREATKKVWLKTLPMFKRILFNPLTLALLIGGMALIFGKTLLGWIGGIVKGIKDGVVPFVIGAGGVILNFLKQTWNVVSTVGVFIFNLVEKMTDPEGFLMKSVIGLMEMVMWFKRTIDRIVKASGKSSVDVLCMWLAGDYVGLIVHFVSGLVKTIWRWLKNQPLMKLILGVVKTIAKASTLIVKLPMTQLSAIWDAIKQAGKFLIGKASPMSIVEAFCRPWRRLWKDIRGVFSFGAVSDEMDRESLYETPSELSEQTSQRAYAAVRGLNMSGTKTVENMDRMDKIIRSSYADIADKSVAERLSGMNDVYQRNANSVSAYRQMLEKIWELGSNNAEEAAQVTAAMLESPSMSQKMLSAFFYYNPQNGDVLSVVPLRHIGVFLQNIRDMMNAPNRNDADVFKQLMSTFYQVNEERSHLINRQGDIISDFVEKVGRLQYAEFDKENQLIDQLRSDQFFLDMNKDMVSTFANLVKGSAKTSSVKGLSGDALGSSRLLTMNLPEPKSGESNSLVIGKPKPPEGSDDQKTDSMMKNVRFSGKMASSLSPSADVDKEAQLSRKMKDDWEKRERKRNELLKKGFSERDLMEQGLGRMSLGEYRAKYDRTGVPDPSSSAGLALRLASGIEAYQSQGQQVNMDGFKFSGESIPILSLSADGLEKNVYMFSPEWQRLYGASTLSDADVMRMLSGRSAALSERAMQIQRQREQLKRQKEERKRRQQEILNMSASVNDGHVEVKVIEDEDAMYEAWRAHMQKRSQLISSGQATGEQLDEMGMLYYSWEEWKRYYRRMHGLPEDGIRRIPFEGKKKERRIDWSARNPLSPDELKKYGIEASTEGPVMIPLEKAMAATSDLLNGAKTMYAIRDGLEVMSQGLKTEAGELKRRREEGIPAAVVQTGDSSSGYAPAPPDQSHYAQVG